MSNDLVIVDGSGLLFKFYYVASNETDKIFMNYIYRIIRQFNPKYMFITFDISKSKHRCEIYSQYKSNRKPVDLDIFEYQKKILDKCKLKIPIVCENGYEADDIISTYAKAYKKYCKNVFIVTSDKDLMSLMYDNIFIFDHFKNRLLNAQDIENKFFVTNAKRIPLVQSLAGDSADNIPGAFGIGYKTAGKISMMHEINATLNDIYNSIGTKIKNRAAKLLIESKKNVYMSYELVKLQNVNINFQLTDIILT